CYYPEHYSSSLYFSVFITSFVSNQNLPVIYSSCSSSSLFISSVTLALSSKYFNSLIISSHVPCGQPLTHKRASILEIMLYSIYRLPPKLYAFSVAFLPCTLATSS